MQHVLILLGLLMFANVAEAVDCHEPPSCESLGYSKTKDKNCIENGYLNCLFDPTYTICVEHNCESLGFTKTDKSSWCNKLIKCKSDETFTLCKALCEVGDVYYADGTCGYVEDYDGTKIPVGVVYYISDGGAHGKVINLHDLGRASSSASFDPANPYQTSNKTFPWGSYGTAISDLTHLNCNGSDYLTVAKTGEHSNPFWSAGESCTDLIVKALGSSSLQYAAGAAHAFYPPDVPEDDPKVGKGKWYLPTLGELMDLYGYNYQSLRYSTGTSGATGTTKSTVNATLQALKDKSAGNAETLTNNCYLSSSECHSTASWGLTMKIGDRSCYSKDYGLYVRASLEF